MLSMPSLGYTNPTFVFVVWHTPLPAYLWVRLWHIYFPTDTVRQAVIPNNLSWVSKGTQLGYPFMWLLGCRSPCASWNPLVYWYWLTNCMSAMQAPAAGTAAGCNQAHATELSHSTPLTPLPYHASCSETMYLWTSCSSRQCTYLVILANWPGTSTSSQLAAPHPQSVTPLCLLPRNCQCS